jgi:ribosomal protein S18 acetylase RimI-like enzyme
MTSVRVATAADYPAFTRLFPELRVPDPLPDVQHFVERMLPRVLVSCEGDVITGYAFWQLYGRTAHLVQLVVDQTARGHGRGRALMDAVRDAVAAAGCTRWYLNVKQDNERALRLYERCHLRIEHESWAMRIRWAQVDALVSDGAGALSQKEPDDAAIAARFGLDRERLALLRARPGTVLVALREGDALVAFAAFDPAYPGLYPFRVARPGLARPLLDACRVHADRARFDFVRLVVEGDAAVKDVLRAAGAEVAFALLQMGAALGDASAT